MLELTQAAVHLSFGGRLLFAFSVRVFCNDESVILTKMKHYGRCVGGGHIVYVAAFMCLGPASSSRLSAYLQV